MLLRLFIFALWVGLASACVKTEKIIETRQASPDIKESFRPPQGKTLQIQTSALGKVFLLIANSKTTGSQAKWIEHPVKLVTFEKAGAQVGMFEVGYAQVYDVLASQKLLQTFEIVSETPDMMTLNLQGGFRMVGETQELQGMKQDPETSALKNQGFDEGLTVKEALVTKAELSGNRLLISQKTRYQARELRESSTRVQKVETKSQALRELETSYDSRIEILPYVENTRFKAQEQVKDWTIGSFLTRVFFKESAQSRDLVLKWDTSNPSPIRYIITGTTPREVVPILRQGLEYWNRVAGRTLLTVEESGEADVEPQDHAVIVRWIPWKDAGFAYAGIQYNPLTGEIYRGQMYLTSSWLESGELRQEMQGAAELTQGTCDLGQRLAKEMHSLTMILGGQAPSAVWDYLRMVVAHEAGHTLGMRHHFSAASQIKTPFSEILAARELYKKDPSAKNDYPEFSVSVMDYTQALDSAVIGNEILSRSLSYDQDFINWIYNDSVFLRSAKSGVCTDDHLQYAREENITIYGCGPFKAVGAPFIAELEDLERSELRALSGDVEKIVGTFLNPDGTLQPLVAPDFFFPISQIVMQRSSTKLQNYLFTLIDPVTRQEENPLLTTAKATSDLVLGTKSTSSDFAAERALKSELDVILREPRLRSYFLAVDSAGNLNLNWLKAALEKIHFEKYRKGKTVAGTSYEIEEEAFDQLAALVEDLLRDTLREKLNQSVLRLLVDKDQIESSLLPPERRREGKVEISQRSWFKYSDAQGLLKTYIQQLLTADLGSKKITEYKDQAVFAKMFATDLASFEKLKKSLSESELSLGLDLVPVAEKRNSDLASVLADMSVYVDPAQSVEDQLKVIEEAQWAAKIDFALARWAKSELALIKGMRTTGSL